MSINVLVIPEDPTSNGYILKPLIERMMASCGRPNAHVEVLTNPRPGGFEHAKNLIVNKVLDRYSHMDLLIFTPDRDGKNRDEQLRRLETIAREKERNLLCCAAVEEIEAWLLAGHTDKLSQSWQEIRADISVKEHIFNRFLDEYGDSKMVGGGRKMLMKETLANYKGLLARCQELAELENRIRTILT